MIEGTGLEDAVHIANSAKEFKEKVLELSSCKITDELVQTRFHVVSRFSNTLNARSLEVLI